MIKLYGIASSRASRNMWMLDELDLDYEHVPINDHNGETRSPEFMQLNPNGKVPLLIDGEYKLFESIAINLHLARKYGDDLWFEDIDLQGQATQWSIWSMIEIDENVMHVLMAVDDAQRQRGFASLQAAAKVIDDILQEKEYLIEERFSVADLNAAACFSGGIFMQYNFSEYTHLCRWLRQCYKRKSADIAGSSIARFRDALG